MTELVTFTEQYTSLKALYRSMIFPSQPYSKQWSITEIDELDVNFFFELMSESEQLDELIQRQKPQEEVYLSEIW